MSSLSNQFSAKPKKRARLRDLADRAVAMLRARAHASADPCSATSPRDLMEALCCSKPELRDVMRAVVDADKAEAVDGANLLGHPEIWYRYRVPFAPRAPYVPLPPALTSRNSHLCGRCGQRAYGKSEKWRRKHRKKECDKNIVEFVLTT